MCVCVCVCVNYGVHVNVHMLACNYVLCVYVCVYLWVHAYIHTYGKVICGGALNFVLLVVVSACSPASMDAMNRMMMAPSTTVQWRSLSMRLRKKVGTTHYLLL